MTAPECLDVRTWLILLAVTGEQRQTHSTTQDAPMAIRRQPVTDKEGRMPLAGWPDETRQDATKQDKSMGG